MKKNLTRLLAVSGIGLLLLPACKKDGNLAMSNGGKAGALTASVTTLPLDKTKLNDPSMVINFNFTPPDFGYSAAVTNTLQIDVPGDNWKNPTSATLGIKVYSQGYSTADFNNLVLKLNVPAGVATPIEIRVQHSISATVAPVYSNTISLTVTAFNLISFVYVPGSYEGWSNPGAQEDSLVSATGNGVYTGIINFTAGNFDFLIVPVKGSWANKYATTAGAVKSGTSATYPTEYVTGGGNNFFAPTTAGYYLVTLNTNTSTLTIVPADYYSVIGDAAQGWSTDVPMKYINDGSGNWVVTTQLVSTGSFKVRQDDAWGFSWGIPNAGTAGAGVANTLNDTKNGNIPVPVSGSHTVTFNAPLTTFGTTPPVTTNYTYQ